MQIIINVVDVRIIKWTVYPSHQCVVVEYETLTDSGAQYERSKAVWWVTIPTIAPEGYIPGDPSCWYQLPAEYVETLTNLTIDARTALLGLIASC